VTDPADHPQRKGRWPLVLLVLVGIAAEDGGRRLDNTTREMQSVA
jgi:hypothetical protein